VVHSLSQSFTVFHSLSQSFTVSLQFSVPVRLFMKVYKATLSRSSKYYWGNEKRRETHKMNERVRQRGLRSEMKWFRAQLKTNDGLRTEHAVFLQAEASRSKEKGLATDAAKCVSRGSSCKKTVLSLCPKMSCVL
jgi:hypothetical protein